MGEMTLDHFCRLCLKETFTLSDIFSQRSASGDPVYKTLNFLYDLEICQDDGLPTQICAPCLWRMIEFEAYKKNVHCAKVEILKLFGKTQKDEVSGGDSNDDLGMEDQEEALEHVVSEVEEEEEEEVRSINSKMPSSYGQVYEDQQRASSWHHQPQQHHSQQHPLAQHLPPHISISPQPPHISISPRQPLPPPVVHPQPSQQVFPERTKVAPKWPHIPKDISVRPICPAVPPEPRMPEGYLSQSGVHFLAGALMTNEKELPKEIPEQEELGPIAEKPSSLRNQDINKLSVFVKQEVEELEEQNLDEEMHQEEMVDYSTKSDQMCSQPEEGPLSLCAEDLRSGASKMQSVEGEAYGYDWSVANTSRGESGQPTDAPLLDGNEAFVCDVCKKSYSEKIHLGEHMKYHYQNRHYFCRVCGDRFQQSRARGRHELLHLKEEVCQKKKEKPHTCGTCGKQFSSKSSFYRHCNEHTDKYACPTCGKSFSCSKDLKRHTIIHSNEKPFQCEVCQRSFNQKGNLNKHMVTHSMERPFDCTMCDRKFKTKRERNNHELTHLRRQVFPKASPILH